MMRCSNCKRYVSEIDIRFCLDCERFFCPTCGYEHKEAMRIAEEEKALRREMYSSILDNTDTDLTKSLNS